jgi:hypothetical protein
VMERIARRERAKHAKRLAQKSKILGLRPYFLHNQFL